MLSYRDGQWIFIYKEESDDSSFCYHALYSTIHQDLTINDSGFTLLSDAITPATKVQRDLLFQKMKEAGYEWDAEKKESKKIEDELKNYKQQVMSETADLVKDYIRQKPVWTEEDDIMECNIVDHLCQYYVSKKGYPYVADKNSPEMKEMNWLKSIRDRIQS